MDTDSFMGRGGTQMDMDSFMGRGALLGRRGIKTDVGSIEYFSEVSFSRIFNHFIQK